MIAVFYLFYLTAALFCLRQWGSPDPWSRLDVFSGGFFAFAPLWLYETLVFSRIGSEKEVRDVAVGKTYDPGMLRWIAILALGELVVFADYGHFRLMPALVNPVLQGMGLALWAVTPLWLLWADHHLRRHFSKPENEWTLVTDGPFRYLRHPRYAALLVSRAAFALLFASVLAWLFELGWLGIVLRRIRLEEAHLVGRYGVDYKRYAGRTARLIPYVY